MKSSNSKMYIKNEVNSDYHNDSDETIITGTQEYRQKNKTYNTNKESQESQNEPSQSLLKSVKKKKTFKFSLNRNNDELSEKSQKDFVFNEIKIKCKGSLVIDLPIVSNDKMKKRKNRTVDEPLEKKKKIKTEPFSDQILSGTEELINSTPKKKKKNKHRKHSLNHCDISNVISQPMSSNSNSVELNSERHRKKNKRRKSKFRLNDNYENSSRCIPSTPVVHCEYLKNSLELNNRKINSGPKNQGNEDKLKSSEVSGFNGIEGDDNIPTSLFQIKSPLSQINSDVLKDSLASNDSEVILQPKQKKKKRKKGDADLDETNFVKSDLDDSINKYLEINGILCAKDIKKEKSEEENSDDIVKRKKKKRKDLLSSNSSFNNDESHIKNPEEPNISKRFSNNTDDINVDKQGDIKKEKSDEENSEDIVKKKKKKRKDLLSSNSSFNNDESHIKNPEEPNISKRFSNNSDDINVDKQGDIKKEKSEEENSEDIVKKKKKKRKDLLSSNSSFNNDESHIKNPEEPNISKRFSNNSDDINVDKEGDIKMEKSEEKNGEDIVKKKKKKRKDLLSSNSSFNNDESHIKNPEEPNISKRFSNNSDDINVDKQGDIKKEKSEEENSEDIVKKKKKKRKDLLSSNSSFNNDESHIKNPEEPNISKRFSNNSDDINVDKQGDIKMEKSEEENSEDIVKKKKKKRKDLLSSNSSFNNDESHIKNPEEPNISKRFSNNTDDINVDKQGSNSQELHNKDTYKTEINDNKQKKHGKFRKSALEALDNFLENVDSTDDDTDEQLIKIEEHDLMTADKLDDLKYKSGSDDSLPRPPIDVKIKEEKKCNSTDSSIQSTMEDSRTFSKSNCETSDSSEAEVDDLSDLDSMRSFLKKLDFVIDFPIPRLHEICNRASQPTPMQRAKLKNENISIKNGKFVKAEDCQIINNYTEFIKKFNIKDMPELFSSLDKKYITVQQKQNFLFFLAQNLNDRTPFSVYQRFKILMLQRKRGRFTEDEDEYILRKIKETNCERNSLSEIAHHLQRSLSAIQKRIDRLKYSHTRKIHWKPKNVSAFIKYMLKVTKISEENMHQLKNRHVTSNEWTKLSKKLDNVPIRILKRAWLVQIHPALFIPDTICDLRKIKWRLIEMFYENKENDWRAVDWKKYASYFDGLTPLRVYSLMKTLVNTRIPDVFRDNLRKSIKILKKIPRNDFPKHVINKIEYRDGEVFELRESDG